MDSPPIHCKLLVDIFLRLGNPADLVRASAACASFRRIVADRCFLRQYRKIHAPPLLGFLDKPKFFHPAKPPYPSASAARAVALAADLSFAFLPAPASNWVVKDIRDGRVLLDRMHFKPLSAYQSTEIVVCDPLYRRYLVLPPIPDEVVTSVENLQRPCQTFLIPAAGSTDMEAAEETAFRVIWMARHGDKLVSLVFSSSTEQWQDGPSHSWSNLFSSLLRLPRPQAGDFSRPQCAYGCFYWVTDCREKLLVLDTTRMKFSVADAPPEAKDYIHIAIVEAGEGRPGMFVRTYRTPDLSYIIRRNNGGSSGQWQVEKTISLGFWYSFTGSTGRHLFLEHSGDFFSLDVKTFQLETVCASEYVLCMFWPRAYSNFPPSLLSAPTVASGVEIGTEKEVLQAQVHSRHG